MTLPDNAEGSPLSTLDSFAALEKGWDSYGGAPITPEAIASARLALTGKSFVVPTSQGGVAIEWQDGDLEVSLEIRPDGNPVGYYGEVDPIPNPEGAEAVAALAEEVLDERQVWAAHDAARWANADHEQAMLATKAMLAADERMLALREAIQFGDDKARMAVLTDTTQAAQEAKQRIQAEARAEERERSKSLAEAYFPDLAVAFHTALRHRGLFAKCRVAACADHQKAATLLSQP